MKPLSPKTLEKKYAELGLPQEKLSLLHDYYRSFANLYGVITVREAWDVFRYYEGLCTIHKKDLSLFPASCRERQGFRILFWK